MNINQQNGIALIAVLWVTAFLTTIASTVAYQSRNSLKMTKNRIELLQTREAAESGMLFTIADLINAPESRGISNYQTDLSIKFNDITVKVNIYDESGKIDLNTAPAAFLQGLLLAIGLDQVQSTNITNAILDWRDSDELARIGSAEDTEYRQLGLNYESKDADFQQIEELNLIYGMTPTLYNELKPHVTVYTQDFGINLSVASNLVQRAFSIASELDSSSVQVNDEEYFGDASELISATSGYIYTIESRATNNNGLEQAISVIVRLDRGNLFEPFTILQWNQI